MILDAPATGHGVAVLRAPRTFAETRRGWARSRARARIIDAMLSDPAQTGVVAVARPEEMPVNETLALRGAAARRASALRVDARRRQRRCCPTASRRRRAALERAPPAHPAARGARAPQRGPAPSAPSSRGCGAATGGAGLHAALRRRADAPRTAPALARAGARRWQRAASASGSRASASCICAGSGGVGKTTTSAALAMGLAAQGPRVAVVTIDPARRLANSLGLDELDNEPRLVDPARFAGHGLEIAASCGR